MQLAFDFAENARPVLPGRSERLFFGVMPGGDALPALARFAEAFLARHAPGARPIAPERLHVSLHHLRDDVRLRESTLFAARQAARRIALHPFQQRFHRATGFPALSPRKAGCPLVLLADGEGLPTLHRQIASGLAAIGWRAGGIGAPHMTLAYARRPLPAATVPPIGFEVREVLLIHSRRGLSEYRVIERWPLRG